MDYNIKGLKGFKGHEGEPLLQGTLYKGATKLAEWTEDSWGGPTNMA